MELMEMLKVHGIEVTGVVKAYLKACVIALLIQLDCIDRVRTWKDVITYRDSWNFVGL